MRQVILFIIERFPLFGDYFNRGSTVYGNNMLLYMYVLCVCPGPGVVSCTDGWVSSSATELVVSWEQPESPNGIITGYYLELHEYQVTGAAIASREITDNSTSTTFSGLALGEHIVLAKPLCQHLAWWDGCTVC